PPLSLAPDKGHTATAHICISYLTPVALLLADFGARGRPEQEEVVLDQMLSSFCDSVLPPGGAPTVCQVLCPLPPALSSLLVGCLSTKTQDWAPRDRRGSAHLEELKEKLTEYVDKVNGQKPGFIKVVRHSKQEGLIRSRVSGWRAATAPVVALFDAHVEFSVWQCGGSVEVLPCSRIAHIERAHKPYTEDLTAHVRRNALRVAEVWMDEFKSHVYMAWNIPQEDSGIDIGDITARKALRKQLQCKTFRWYLVSVYPEMRMYSDIIAYGVLQNSLKTDLCLDQGPETENVPIVYICHGMTPQRTLRHWQEKWFIQQKNRQIENRQSVQSNELSEQTHQWNSTQVKKKKTYCFELYVNSIIGYMLSHFGIFPSLLFL
ncbi:hypothetical protein FD754_013299, partial [Muntiacus muntjak]